jgi:hypothetical protein
MRELAQAQGAIVRPPSAVSMAVMIGDHAEATIGLGIGYGPEPVVGRGAIYAPAYGAVGFNPLLMDRMVPEAHRLRIGEASVHRDCILGPELTQTQPTS